MGLGNCPKCWDVDCSCDRQKQKAGNKWITVSAWIAVSLLTFIPAYKIYLETGVFTSITLGALLFSFWKDQLIN